MKSFLSKVNYYLKIILFSKWTWKSPRKCKLLVFDKNFSEYYLEYIDQKEFEILYTRGEVINVPILIKSIIKTFPKKILHNYFEEYIKTANPETIITGVDVNTYFWGLKKIFKDKKFVMIQSSKRGGTSEDIFGYLFKNKIPEKSFMIDYIFVWGNCIKEKYNKYIKGEYIVSGSFINNKMNINPKESNNIGFVSQASDYRDYYIDGVSLGKVMLDSTEILIENLKKFINNKNYKIKIFPYNSRNEKNYIFEYNFYKERLKGFNYEFCYKENRNDNYKHLDDTKIIIGLTSSILYEALARKNKVAFFNYFEKSNISGYSFGWPKKLPSEGEFWTESTSYLSFEKIFNNLNNYDEIEWENLLKKYIPDIISYDEGNIKFKNLIKKIDIKIV